MVAMALVSCLLMSGSAIAGDARWWSDRERGWFWYQEPPPPPPPEATPITPGKSDASAPSSPRPLSTAWLRANLDRLLDQAIDDPTPENVELYLLAQRYAMDRSERFAHAVRSVVLATPSLDETVRHPSSGVHADALASERERLRQTALTALADDHGLWYVYSSTCPYCARQTPILWALHQLYGIRVLAISIDGGPVPGLPDAARGDWITVVQDEGQVDQLGTAATPSLYLVRPPNGISIVAEGLRSLPELEERILEAALREQWLPPSIAAALDVRRTPLAAPVELPTNDDPRTLLDYLRRYARSSQ